MSGLGQERTYWCTRIMSAFGGKADEIVEIADIGAWLAQQDKYALSPLQHRRQPRKCTNRQNGLEDQRNHARGGLRMACGPCISGASNGARPANISRRVGRNF